MLLASAWMHKSDSCVLFSNNRNARRCYTQLLVVLLYQSVINAVRDAGTEDESVHLEVSGDSKVDSEVIFHTNHLSLIDFGRNGTVKIRPSDSSFGEVRSLAGRSLVLSFNVQDGKAHIEDQETEKSASHRIEAPKESFEVWAKTFPWEHYKANTSADAIKDLVEKLIPFAVLEHPVPAIPLSTCAPDSQLSDLQVSCGDFPKLFRGKRSGGPAEIVDAFVFGYDLDLLEVRLNELDSVVDLFVLIEMPVSHKGLPKPLVYASNKQQPRFDRFRNKILYVLVNDVGVARLQEKYLGDAPWDSVSHQEVEGVRKMRQGLASIFGTDRTLNNVVLSFGDLDEIPSVENLKLMRECDPWRLPIDQGSWFPFGRFDRAFRTDWPVDDQLPYTFGNPSFFDISKFQGRQYGKNGRESGRYLLGGWHLTWSAYLPNHLLKTVMCHDMGGLDEATINLFKEEGGARKAFTQIQDLPPPFQARVTPISMLTELDPMGAWQYRPPRYMACNKDRFELWYGIYDRRLSLKP